MKIMFVCTGNICRSAMGHALLEKRVKELGKDITVYSSGVYAYTGDGSTSNAIEVMKDEYEVDLTKHRAINTKNSNIEEMDLILCATENHKCVILEEYPNLKGKNKVFTIKEYVGLDKNSLDLDINDPYGGTYEAYRSCAKEISDCIEKILERV